MISDKRTLRDIFCSCHHEAGHATVALAVGVGVEWIHIHVGNGAWGETHFNEEDALWNASNFDLLTYTVAGTVAERIRYLNSSIPLSGGDKSGAENLLKHWSENEREQILARAFERAELALEKNKGVYKSLKTCLENRQEADRHDIRRALKFNQLTRIP
jgi:hypothetical protein